MVGVTIRNSSSQLVFQRDGKILVTPGENRPVVAASVRLCAQLEAITAGSYLFNISQVALWGSAARGQSASDILDRLGAHAAMPIPAPVAGRIAAAHARYGAIWLERDKRGDTRIYARDPAILSEAAIQNGARLSRREVGAAKRRLAATGWPVVERGARASPDGVSIELGPTTKLRGYQAAAVAAHEAAGNGLVLLPCGAGKTMVGVGAICASATSTLILTPAREIALQWERALTDMTTVDPGEIALLPAELPGPITIATYQSASRGRIGSALAAVPWGLVIYDEVQSLPADVFRTVSAISADRRLGLSATLVREDGREADVFAMVGPVVYDVPWIELEREGWIAPARCYEVRIPEAADGRARARFKHAVIERILDAQSGRPALVVGSNVQALTAVARRFELPLLTGRDGPGRREEVFECFRSGAISRLAVSRIGSTGLDLPSAEVMIQVNGNFGSRQEEAQRLGRLLRPGSGEAVDFYTLVSLGTREPEYARKRQRFLVDQGYEYQILDAAELPRVSRTR